MTDSPDRTAAATPYERFLATRATAAAEGPRRIEVGVPMRDGIELAADVYLPADARLPAPAVVQVTPYDKSAPMFVGEGEWLQRHDYVAVVVDCRGRGKSEGDWRWFVNDGPDGFDVIEWVAAQQWCDGNVGTTGLSYMGWTQWAAAAQRPPSLRCMVSTAAAGRWQEEIPYTNGIFQLYFVWWLLATRRRIADAARKETIDWSTTLRRLPLSSLGAELDLHRRNWADAMEHDRLDDFWQALRLDGHYDEIDVPCLSVAGWFDLEDLLGAFHHYEGMVASSPAAADQHLLVGPWNHVMTRWPHHSCGGVDFGPDAVIDLDAVHLAWFDRWLRGADLGDTPRVRLFDTGERRWDTGERWRPEGNSTTRLFLGQTTSGAGSLTGAPGTAGSRSYRFDPEDPIPTGLDADRYPEGESIDQAPFEQRDDIVVFSSEELSAPVAVSGTPQLLLYAATDGDDTDWHVKLTDVDADGRSIKVSSGCLRGSHASSRSEPQPLRPGEVTCFAIELGPCHHTFLPGHRIRLTVTSSDFPWFSVTTNRFGRAADLTDPRVAVNAVHFGGDNPSAVLLPLREGQGAPAQDH